MDWGLILVNIFLMSVDLGEFMEGFFIDVIFIV